MSDDGKRVFIVEQTEQFRVRATSAEEAEELVANNGDGQQPDVEWVGCTSRIATEV